MIPYKRNRIFFRKISWISRWILIDLEYLKTNFRLNPWYINLNHRVFFFTKILELWSEILSLSTYILKVSTEILELSIKIIGISIPSSRFRLKIYGILIIVPDLLISCFEVFTWFREIPPFEATRGKCILWMCSLAQLFPVLKMPLFPRDYRPFSIWDFQNKKNILMPFFFL